MVILARRYWPKDCERSNCLYKAAMKHRIIFLTLIVVVLESVFTTCAGQSPAARPTAQEMQAAERWVKQHLSARAEPPFSFVYGGKASAAMLGKWKVKRETRKLDKLRTGHTITYNDKETGLSVRMEAVTYSEFSSVEWTLYFKNTGKQDTSILENIQALDSTFKTGLGAGDYRINYNHGCNQLITDFKPEVATLAVGSNLSLGCSGGRSSSALLLPPATVRANSTGVMPFFNLEKPDGNGIIIAVGWSGQWAATFTRTSADCMNVRAGMELTHLKLHPGEEIRTPSVVMLFWSGGDKIAGHNQWRRLVLDHYSPTPGGKEVSPPVAASPHGTVAFTGTTEANMIQAISNIVSNHLPVDTLWIDAGWYMCWSVPNVAPWNTVGTWDPDPTRYPNGMKPVADAAHSRGMRFLLWFEVERAVAGSWVANNHPEWLLGHNPLPADLAYQEPFMLVNFGNPAALAWAKDKISNMIRDVGIDIYRIDLNMDPLYYWRHNEPADRQGITEIQYITGWYDYLDTLVKNTPNLIIDNCAGGGRRLDIEMVKRAISLTPSDYLWEPTGEQSMNYALSLWLPWHGIGSVSLNPYDFISGMGASFVWAGDLYASNPSAWTKAAELLTKYKAIKGLYTGEFYPLTPYSTDNNVWMAWQYKRPSVGDGMVQAFRRADNGDAEVRFKLRGLDPGARYKVADFDAKHSATIPGRQLMEAGLVVKISDKPGAAVIFYERVK